MRGVVGGINGRKGTRSIDTSDFHLHLNNDKFLIGVVLNIDVVFKPGAKDLYD